MSDNKLEEYKSSYNRNIKFQLEFSPIDHARLIDELKIKQKLFNDVCKFGLLLNKISYLDNGKFCDAVALYQEKIPFGFEQYAACFGEFLESGRNFLNLANYFRNAVTKKPTSRFNPEASESQKQKAQKLLDAKKSGIALIQCGVLPVVNNDAQYTDNHYYGTITQACEHTQSYLKCSRSTSDRFEFIKLRLKNFREENDLHLFVEKRKGFNSWLQEMQQFKSFSLNYKFLSNWKRRFSKAILNNKPLRWSLNQDAISICKRYDYLFDDKDFIYLFGNEYLLSKKLNSVKKQSEFSFSDSTLSISPRYGKNNHDRFNITQNEGGIYVEFASCKSGEPPLVAKLIPHKNTFSWELESCVVISDKTKKPVNKQFLIVKRKSDRCKKIYDLNEVRLEFKNNQFSLNIIRCGKNQHLKEKLFYWCKFFETSLNSSTKKTEDRLPYEFRSSFIDIGINPIMTIGVYDYSRYFKNGIPVQRTNSKLQLLPYGYAQKIFDRQIGVETNTKLHSHIKLLDNKIAYVRSVIAFWKNITKLDGFNRILDLNSTRDLSWVPFDELNEIGFNLLADCKHDDIEITIKKLEDTLTQEKIDVLKKHIMNYFALISKEFSNIRMTRRNNDFGCECYKWLFVIKNFISVKKSLTYASKKPLEKGETRNPKDFCKLQKYCNNYSKDLLQKVAAQLRDFCVKNKIDVCVMEDLEHFRANEANAKGLNKLLSVWSHRKFVGKIKQVLEEVQIPLVFINAEHSSQLYPYADKLQWGCRDNMNRSFGDKTKLWVKINNDTKFVNADVSATDVLARRFFTRHADFVHVVTYVTSDKKSPFVIKSDTSRRLTSFIKRNVGSNYAAIDYNGRMVRISKKQYGLCLSAKKEDFYLHDGLWVNREWHKKLQLQIRDASGEVALKTTASLAPTQVLIR